MSANPVLVEVTRGDVVESRHRGAVAVVDAAGGIVWSAGDVGAPVYPRSAVKSLQALALVESGEADRLGLDDAALAVLCSSHGGEQRHVAVVADLLERIGLGVDDLECGPHWPSHAESARDLARRGEHPSALHNNCSGKHAGMLALARALGVPTAGYAEVDHPVQQRICGVLSEMTGVDLGAAPVARDGCSVPTWAVPLGALARAFARVARPDGLEARRRVALARLRDAAIAEPFMVAGTGRFDTRLMERFRPRLFTKTGAEGVFCAALPDQGLGIAVKCDDGAGRAAEVILAGTLATLGLLGDDGADALGEELAVPVENWRGFRTGVVRWCRGA
jgi:L-asparaginase II